MTSKYTKNADAARRSWQLQVMKMENLKREAVEMTIKNNELKNYLAILEVQRKSLEEKGLESDRIEELESQLGPLLIKITKIHKPLLKSWQVNV